jgi:hypothetical protein
MAKLDLALISQAGNGRPVPEEMDLNIIKYIVGKRKDAVERDPSLLVWNRWNHSKVFYEARTYLNRQQGWDTSVYSDTAVGGKERRGNFYDKIKPVCEGFYGKKRHELGIFPNDRATMTFTDEEYAVSFHSLPRLMSIGTDVVFVEKQNTVTLMSPYAETTGISFIDSEGFGSEYGVALARLCNMQWEVAKEYTSDGNGKYYFPEYQANLANITDCDVSGVAIGIKINQPKRIGLDLNTIQEINNVNQGLDLQIEDLEEDIDTSKNTHYKGLLGVLNGKGKLHDSLSEVDRLYYRNCLLQKFVVNGEEIFFIDWLAHHRIELDTVLAAAEPEGFWNWLRWKLENVWSERNGNRAITLEEYLHTPTMDKFTEWYQKKSGSVLKDKLKEKREELSKKKGLFEDINEEKENIEDNLINNTLLPHDKIKKIDLALKRIMEDEDSPN